MQDLSFNFNDPVFELKGLHFSVQVFTFENVYGLRDGACDIRQSSDRVAVDCGVLTWAGGQEVTPGHVFVSAEGDERATTFAIEATVPQTIRCTKLILKNLPRGEIINLREASRFAIPPDGFVLHYPGGWRGLYTPLVIMNTGDGRYLYVRSLDTRVREKRFALLPNEDTVDIELIFEENATEMANRVVVPRWEIGTCADPVEILREHTRYVVSAYNLESWEQRQDVPDWARRIALVAAIHCQHWTGYKFNDYAQVLATLRWLATRLEPERILAYLPGWEGRYYWQYGDYRPDPRMGGPEGFAHLMQGACELGIRVMPMFGINVVNRGQENFEQWGVPALSTRAGGVGGGATVDWDSSRHYDHVWAALLNPGAPTWQNRLVAQITSLIDTYRFDGVFLDISAVWLNDPRFNTYEGVIKLVQRIREHAPHVLIAGEGWYDAIGQATPLVQAGHTDGAMHWHDEPYPPIFEPYNRGFGHLCLGDPSRGSTGVHELGYNRETRAPLRKSILPTVTIVEDTLAKAPEQVMEIIDDARRYASTYLSGA